MKRSTFFVLAVIFACSQMVLSQEATQQKSAENGKKPAVEKPDQSKDASKGSASKSETIKTETIKLAPFRVDVSLKGNFVSKATTDVVLRPKSWSLFKVEKAVPHGSWVGKGETVVWMDAEKLTEAIASAENSLGVLKLELVEAEANLKMQEKSLSLDKQAIELAKENANDELQHFQKVGRALAEETARTRLKSSEFSLEYYQEELTQLEKMYAADDLTEETEEIILKRARKQVEFAQFNLQLARNNALLTLEKQIPLQAKVLADNAERYNLLFAKAEVILPVNIDKTRLAIDKLKLQIQNTEDNLSKLKFDLELMNVKAPVEGVVYYGQWNQGQWSGKSTADAQLRKGGTLSANQVFMTIVSPRNLEINALLDEKDLHLVRQGISGRVAPTAFPKVKLQAAVSEVSAVPVAKGKFDCNLSLIQALATQNIMPGMTCDIMLVAYMNQRAISIAESTVFTEELDEDSKYVYLALADDKHKKQPVEIGHTSDKKVEIVSGLSVGDKILLQKPKDAK